MSRDRLIADTEAKKTVYEGQGAMSKGDQIVTDEALGALLTDVPTRFGFRARPKRAVLGAVVAGSSKGTSRACATVY